MSYPATPGTPGTPTDGTHVAPALGILVAVGLLLAGGLITGLATDLDGGSWKVRVKFVALSGQFLLAAGGGGGVAVGLALLLAVYMARTPTVGRVAAALGSWMLGVTAASFMVDISYLADLGENGTGAGLVAGLLVADLGALTIVATATWWGWSAAHR
ncbi:MAG: hypothetical protein ACRD1K_08585 [Acidimicrobiales bacterium]